jgi:DNA polymerase-3 subunit epsilon
MTMTPDFVFFDVETPNKLNDKICSIGIVRTTYNGDIKYKQYYVVNPECGFDRLNVSINGIIPSEAAKSHTFEHLWKSELAEVFSGSILVAHNIYFDLSVLEKTLDFYDMSIGSVECDCTLRLSRNHLPHLSDYKLDTICRDVGIPLTLHHNAFNDAEACMRLFWWLEKVYGVKFRCGIPYIPNSSVRSTDKQALSKAMSDLYGITIGISIDDVLVPEELVAYDSWLNDNSQYKKQPFFKECMEFVEQAISDNELTLKERDGILSIAAPFVAADGSSMEAQAIREFLGIIKGISADRRINEREAENLLAWMGDSAGLQRSASFKKAIYILNNALSDGIISKEEEQTILALFDSLINPAHDNEGTGGYSGKKFCLTGDFVHGTKTDVEKHINALGGECVKGVSKKCDFVVIGGLGSDKYKYGNYGSKVKYAMELKDDGFPIMIIQEDELYGNAQ